MELKILTINIWRYYKWDQRKEELIRFLKEQDADIIFLQEAAYDDRLKSKFKNQVDEINKELNYEGQTFSKMTKMAKWHQEPIDWDMWYGFGILSKFPINESDLVILPHINKNKNYGFLHTTLETPLGTIDLINVHFENTDEGSKEHLKQTLEWCREKSIQPLIAGDFNMFNLNNLFDLAKEEYQISYKVKPYFSFMPTKFSNNKGPVTLDHVLVYKSKFTIEDVNCISNEISDHNPVIALVKIIN